MATPHAVMPPNLLTFNLRIEPDRRCVSVGCCCLRWLLVMLLLGCRQALGLELDNRW
jgi:hypothetical protein